MKHSNEQGLGDAIKALFKTYHLDSKVNEIQIKEKWELVMGKTIARYTSDIKLKDGNLSISLTSAPLKQDLKYNKEKIIQRINEEFGEPIVKEIYIK